MTPCYPLALVSRRLLLAVLLLIAFHSLQGGAIAQSPTATLSGTVTDPNNAVVAGARVTATNTATGLKREATTSGSGTFVIPLLPPSSYSVLVENQGFTPAEIRDVTLQVGDNVALHIQLKLGQVGATVEVKNDAPLINESPSVSTVVDQRLVRELPLNGRSFQTLFQLTPGVVITPTSFASQGQFSVNGQRTNANYFTVDGASANVGIAAGAQPGESLGGSLPALSAAGGTNSLVSTDAVQEFAIQTSSYAPEFGRTPGAQISVVTRSGENQFHGDVFDYLRNDVFDANDWFANRNGLKRAALRQNDFGGVLGGPIYKNRTFFFFSYEGLRLRQPTTAQTDVPSLTTRNAAPIAMQPFFGAYPLPTGADKANGLAPAIYAFSNPANLDATSVRVDHHFTKSLSIFGRYNNSPSNIRVRGSGNTALSVVTETALKLQTLTLGSTYVINPALINEVRFNWSRSTGRVLLQLDNFGGAVPLPSQSLFPSPFSQTDSNFSLNVSSAGVNDVLQVGRNVANVQEQINFVDGVSSQIGAHSLKVGIDFRRLTPQFVPPVYLQTTIFGSAAAALSQISTVNAVQAMVPVNSRFINWSVYAQDTWRPIPRLSLTYGLRWDYNPAPTGSGSNGVAPFAVNGISNLATLSLAPAGTPIYHSPSGNFAPRFGFSYQLRKSSWGDSVLRAGGGVFYDLGNGPAGNAFGLFWPFISVRVNFGTPFPLTGTNAAPPVISSSPPVTASITAFPATLKLPYTYHFNASFEQGIGTNQALTISYVGALGHRLLRTDQYVGAPLPSIFQGLVLATNNAGYSKYNALQVQFRRRASKGLDVFASYTLAHSLDNISSDALLSVPGQFVDPRTDYASSDFDIRHTLAVAIDYELPNRTKSPALRTFLKGWSIDPIITARSSPAVNVVVSRNIGFGSYSFRPDLVPGVALFVADPTAPGGRRINPAAFSISTTQRQGNLGRNSFRGFPLFQADLAIRRRFRLTEKFALQARVDAFNILNHPNFSPEASTLGTVLANGTLSLRNGFGISPSMLGRGLQTGAFGSGFSPLYQIGGSRSLQLGLKLEF